MFNKKGNKKKKNKKGLNLYVILGIAVFIVSSIFALVMVLSDIKGADTVEDVALEDEINMDKGKLDEANNEKAEHNHDRGTDDHGDPMHFEHENEIGNLTDEELGHLGGDELLIEEIPEGYSSVEEFYEKVDSGEDFYVYFYSPYCPHCEAMMDSVYDKFEEHGVNYISVDANQKKPLQEAEGIDAVPMIAHYSDGKQVSYIIGERDGEVLDDFFLNDKTLGLDD